MLNKDRPIHIISSKKNKKKTSTSTINHVGLGVTVHLLDVKHADGSLTMEG